MVGGSGWEQRWRSGNSVGGVMIGVRCIELISGPCGQYVHP